MKPILFNTEMVKAILDGRKTQTRRVIKPQPNKAWTMHEPRYFDGCYADGRIKSDLKCPYGHIGDKLWVRETWSEYMGDIFFKASYKENPSFKPTHPILWKPSIFMPKKYSRITLEITDIRVERVRQISGEDAIKEGIKKIEYAFDGHEWQGSNKQKLFTYPMDAFGDLWDSINKKRGYGWDVNPWVWVVEFKQAGGE